MVNLILIILVIVLPSAFIVGIIGIIIRTLINRKAIKDIMEDKPESFLSKNEDKIVYGVMGLLSIVIVGIIWAIS